MPGKLTLKQGGLLVHEARKAIQATLSGKEYVVPKDSFLKEKRGVFVTLLTHPDRDLRGCIGFPLPVKALGDAVADAAVSAAARDPRFPPVNSDEFDSLVLDVSVLTVPEKIAVKDRRELPKKIKCGRDGLIMSQGFGSGLLLPQVATEHNMTEGEFLDATCQKAGLMPGCWLDERTVVETFQAQVFTEGTPAGKVKGEKL